MNIGSLLKGAGSAVSSFLPSPWVIVAVVIALGGAYWKGRSDGIPVGKQQVQEAAQKEIKEAKTKFEKDLAEKQAEVDALVKAENDRILKQNDRIAHLEKEAREAADRYALLQSQKDKVRTEIITKWKTQVITKSCAVEATTATVINQMLDVK
ncbi:hypothetical protein D3C87_1312800 [compost metagenome]